MRAILLFTLFLSISLSSCNSNDAKSTTDKTPTKETDQQVKETPSQKYTITPFSSSTAYSDAKIESMAYAKGKFAFKVTGANYKLGAQTPDAAQKRCANSGKGQHIHLIVDDAPYAAKYVADFEHDVADGEHHLLAFLSRSYHESIKSAGASTVQKVMVKDKTIQSSTPIKEAMLFYSRPKGKYVGKANTSKVMLDFFLANVDLGNGYTVKASINGEEHTLNKWQPYYIEGLPMGKNSVTLTLMKDGQMVKTPLNPVTREFILAEDVEEKIVPSEKGMPNQ